MNLPNVPQAVWGWFFGPGVDWSTIPPRAATVEFDEFSEAEIPRAAEPCRSMGHFLVDDECEYGCDVA